MSRTNSFQNHSQTTWIEKEKNTHNQIYAQVQAWRKYKRQNLSTLPQSSNLKDYISWVGNVKVAKQALA